MGFVTKKRRRSVSGKRPLRDVRTVQQRPTHRRRFLLAGLLVTLLVAAAWRVRGGAANAPAAVFSGAASTESLTVRLVRTTSIRTSQRPNFKYSIVPGGAYSIDELNAALTHDSVAATHYAVFNRADLRMTKLDAPKLMYASFRKGNDVYWTSHPIRIAAGEALITDGHNLARARCGNRLSEEPKSPTTRILSAERELDEVEPKPKTAMLGDGREPPASALQYEVFPPELALSPASTLPAAGTHNPNHLGMTAPSGQVRNSMAPAGVQITPTTNVQSPGQTQTLGDTPPPLLYALDLPALMPNQAPPSNVGASPSALSIYGQSSPPAGIAIAELWKTAPGTDDPPPPSIGKFTLSTDTVPSPVGRSAPGGPPIFTTNAVIKPPDSPAAAPVQTPEPATGLLFVCAGGLVWVLRRWRIRRTER